MFHSDPDKTNLSLQKPLPIHIKGKYPIPQFQKTDIFVSGMDAINNKTKVTSREGRIIVLLGIHVTLYPFELLKHQQFVIVFSGSD